MLQTILNIILPWRWFSNKNFQPVGKAKAANSYASNASVEHYRDKHYYRNTYYRKGDQFFRTDDDSLIEDLILIALLMETFDEDLNIQEESSFNDLPVLDDVVEVQTSVQDDIAAINAAEEVVRQSMSEPRYEQSSYEEPSRNYESSYDSGSSYSSGDSGGGSYD